MSQKISAFYYIRNNKRRVSVLVTSLAMFSIITYISMFLLSATSETYEDILTETSKYIQYIQLAGDDLEYSYSDEQAATEDIYHEAVNRKYGEIKNSLVNSKGIKDAFVVQTEYSYITSLIGNYYVEVPMLNKTNMEKVLKHMGAVLASGRLPDKAGEVVLDSMLIKNYGYKLGDSLSQNKDVKIVGIINCGYYFGCGLADQNNTFYNPMICVLADGTVRDLKSTIEKNGVFLDNSSFVDLKNGERNLQDDVISSISSSTNIIFTGIIVVVATLVVIVSISYMRDRRSEWCLYASIGYSRKAIYFSIIRELLFTFITAFLIAVIVVIVLMKILDILLITELGLQCEYFLFNTLIQILCVYIALFGVLQIPVRLEIFKIKTIDAADDDI
ncbi:MAG: ABC transporter permease [Lachnospiraceae bacterium]|nr:ABC transporter permease [Lachnospiraceae bacterium]